MAKRKIPYPDVGSGSQREWLAEILRYAVAVTEQDVPRGQPGGRYPYALGVVLSFAELPRSEQLRLLDVCNE